jgi:hypothetical protein
MDAAPDHGRLSAQAKAGTTAFAAAAARPKRLVAADHSRLGRTAKSIDQIASFYPEGSGARAASPEITPTDAGQSRSIAA